jgi:hypothetical protein
MRARQEAGGRRQEGYNLIFKPDLVWCKDLWLFIVVFNN